MTTLVSMDIMTEIKNWRGSTLIDQIESPKSDQLVLLMGRTDSRKLSIPELGYIIETLANYHLFLAAEMGRIYARVQYNGDKIERAKLNMIKPVHDSVKVKIDVLKKIFDSKVKEAERKKYA